MRNLIHPRKKVQRRLDKLAEGARITESQVAGVVAPAIPLPVYCPASGVYVTPKEFYSLGVVRPEEVGAVSLADRILFWLE